jgi:hypothetical protein
MNRTGLLAMILGAATAPAMDLTRAVVVTREPGRAAAVLVEEVERRTEIRWPVAGEAPGSWPAIRLERGSGPPEGFLVRTEGETVTVRGNDARGLLYGVGRLLRALEMRRRSVILPAPLNLATAPETRLRGHQLGYRPKTNSYDGWTPALWEQYIRELAVFGVNAVELIPPRSDDDADSPHFPLPPLEMMERMSKICDDYGMDVWIWYPALDRDYGDPKTVESALREWGAVFERLPRIDAVMVPGGDPGATPPKLLMALLEKQRANLRRYHPKAQMWMSPQSFSPEWMEEFFAILKPEPAWLDGIVHGPQVRYPIARLRELVPRRYPIRNYPDITHSRQCQFPAPGWDPAFSVTEARETINPRPADMARIFRRDNPHTIGFITYSEGCNDDVNKIVWSALGWDSKADIPEVLREYGRFFIHPDFADAFAQGLLALERNWQGAVLANGGIYETLQQFQSMERAATPQMLANWRFQQGLYRAYYDALVRARLIEQTRAEERALEALRAAPAAGAIESVARAERILDEAAAGRAAADWRARVFELAEALYQSIRMQLSVPRYKAIAVGRGANLDTIDYPLNSRPWLKEQFASIRRLEPETERLARIAAIVDRTNPGPGGFYDDLGQPGRQPHLVEGAENGVFAPAAVAAAPRPSYNHAETLYDEPLRMRYTGLDRAAEYRVRVVYGMEQAGARVRLVANGRYEVHPLLQKEPRPMEFDIPREATADGELTLSWTQAPGSRGNGRGTQVAEVWLMRKGGSRP